MTSDSGNRTECCPAFFFSYVPNTHNHRLILHIFKNDGEDNEKTKELKFLMRKWVLALLIDPKTFVKNKYNVIGIKLFYPHEVNVST